MASLCLNALGLGTVAGYYLRHLRTPESSGPRSYYERRRSLFKLLGASRAKLVFAGDSITNECEWAELLSMPEAVNRGIDYDTTQGLLRRIHDITTLHPKKLFLLIGTNDLQRDVLPKSIVDNYREILRVVKTESNDTVVYVQSILPSAHVSPGAVSSMNRELALVAEQSGAKYLDINSALSGSNGHLQPDYTNDGVHLMAAGYERWRAVLMSAGALQN